MDLSSERFGFKKIVDTRNRKSNAIYLYLTTNAIEKSCEYLEHTNIQLFKVNKALRCL